MELFQKLFQAARVLSKKKRNRKERGKDETLFEVDTFITAMCIEERDGMLYVSYNRLSRGLHRFSYQLKLRQKNYKCQYN
jgi:hypothetical protein